MKTFYKLSAILLGSACVLMSSMAIAGGQDGHSWLVRGRALAVVPDESANISAIGGDVSISTTIVPEVDISYFFNRHIAAELILATTPHSVTAKNTSLGSIDLGDVTLLPPTLTLQYHFYPTEKIKPYVGAGVNYTYFYDAEHGSAINNISYDDSIGGALQAGVDYMLDDHWLLNFDVKKIWISPDVSINSGAIRANVDINPWVIGAGVGYRF